MSRAPPSEYVAAVVHTYAAYASLISSARDVAATRRTAKQVTVEFVTERLTFRPDADDPFATFQLHLLGAVAEFERALINERQREGIALAKAKGKYRGGTAKLSREQIVQARHLIGEGVPKARVARQLGCARSVLYDALAGRGAYAPTDSTRPTLAGADEIQLPPDGEAFDGA